MCTDRLNAYKHNGKINMKQFNTAIDHEDHRNTSHEITSFWAKGSIAKSASQEVKTLMHKLLANENKIVNLDLSGLDNLDPWGANQLVLTICRILARGQEFSIRCEKLKARNLLKSLHIDELVPILGADSQTGVPIPPAA